MYYLTFDKEEYSEYDVCLLTKNLEKSQLFIYYVKEIKELNTKVIAYELDASLNKASDRREFLQELFNTLASLKVKYVLVADAEYFKTLTKNTKAEPFLGLAVPCAGINNSYGIMAFYTPNHTSAIYDPISITHKIGLSLDGLKKIIQGNYIELGEDIIHSEKYPDNIKDIENSLNSLLDLPEISIDIETFSLKFFNAGLGSITFCKDMHNGLAFLIDLNEKDKNIIRNLLKNFFKKYSGKTIYHNASFDITILIYELFMEGISDYKGLLEGLEVLTKNFEDTKIIAYLALNSCSRPDLSLKSLGHEFSGNYALENISDISSILPHELLRYNLIDGLTTFYVYKKYYPLIKFDKQEDIYLNIFKPALVDIIQMQLVGLPLDYSKVTSLSKKLSNECDNLIKEISTLDTVLSFEEDKKHSLVEEYNTTRKVKRITFEEVEYTFNVNSNPDLNEILFNEKYYGLPILKYTHKGKPSTDANSLGNLLNLVKKDSEEFKFLTWLIDYKAVGKIVSTFLPPMEQSPSDKNGNHFLFGNFNLGGTVSGRLSSSNPNLQNIPATGTKYAKVIKECFKAPKGWVFVGLDFDSLEDKISALTTRDPNKLKVYTDGYDGHSLRAYYYFKDKLPDIDPNSVESINSIKKNHADLRQASKSPTFAKTYQGTYRTLMTKCGFTEKEAKVIDKSYDEMYSVSINWVNEHLKQASKDGYISAAFGLRVRTPLLKQVILGTSKTPNEAAAEGRTAGNALGQSWGLLNSRAASAFLKKVRASKFKYDIMPCAQIHDAQYYLIRNSVDVLKFVNDTLIEEVSWQNDPLIYHDTVKISGTLSVFYPTWANHVDIPNNASKEDIIKIIKEYKESLK